MQCNGGREERGGQQKHEGPEEGPAGFHMVTAHMAWDIEGIRVWG